MVIILPSFVVAGCLSYVTIENYHIIYLVKFCSVY